MCPISKALDSGLEPVPPARRWVAPVDCRPGQLRSMVDQALLFIAEDLFSFFDPLLSQEVSPEWYTDVSERQNRFSRLDVASYGKALERYPPFFSVPREVFRAAFGNDRYGKSHRSLSRVIVVRNEFAHPDRPLTNEETASALTTCVRFATDACLPCRKELEELTVAFEEVRTGRQPVILSLAEFSALRTQVDELRAREAEQNKKIERLDAKREDAEDSLRREVEIRERAQRDLEEYSTELHHLEATLQSREALGEAISESLKTDLASARLEAQAAAARCETIELELDLAKARVAELGELVNAEIEEADSTVEDINAVGSDLAFQQSLARVMDLPDLQETIREIVERLTNAESGSTAGSAVQPLPPVRGEWTYGRGSEVWTLSAASRRMTRREDGVELDELLGPERAKDLVVQFLEIRPTGGRVWVDKDMDAVTYVDERLVYLGCLKRDPDEVLRPGEEWRYPRGYQVWRLSAHEHDLIRRSDGVPLSELVEADAASRLVDSMLEIRPKGGRVWVDQDGDAVTTVEGALIYLGRLPRRSST